MTKMMTEMDLLTKHVMGGGYKAVNVVGDSSGMSTNDAKFDAMYNELVQFGGFSSEIFKVGRESRLKQRWDGDKDRYLPPYDRPKPKELNAHPERFWTEDMLARILNKVEGSDKVLKEMQADFSSLNQTVTSHSISIKQLAAQMGQISAHLILRKKRSLPSDTIDNPKNDNAQCMTIFTSSGKVVESDVPNNDNASSCKWKASVFESDVLAKELNNETSNEVDDASKNVVSGDAKKSNVGVVPPLVPTKSLPKVIPPFPQILEKGDEDEVEILTIALLKPTRANAWIASHTTTHAS
ncbi:hypothetical protein MTR67_027211 [Solanum verrucosum]|uniref:Uncharacterized protein n=1 Tax=Solanum verrucosum TaxID=315347 RepID=A0AAF0R1W6_SOLVR|nr:hypothetical protein MTR67_027211 [Solanum verrucosum]